MRIINLSWLLVAVSYQVARAETNLVWATNWLKSDSAFRVVDGQLFNVSKSSRFDSFRGDVVEVLTNGLVISQEVRKTRPIRRRSDSLVSSGNFLGSSGAQEVSSETYWESTGKFVFIKNYPGDPAVGQVIELKCAKIKNANWNGSIIEAYDYGLPNYCIVITTNGRIARIVSTNSSPAKTQ
jgi:hypothetical protein